MQNNNTALHAAAAAGHTQAVQVLLFYHAAVNAYNEVCSSTLLVSAGIDCKEQVCMAAVL